jgi:hypothetical protein
MLAAAALSLALYAITLGGTYIYDDRSVVQDDTRIQSPRQWGKLWTESYNGGVDNLYRPLDSQIFALQWWLHGDRPWAFHLVNILLNAAAAAAVAELARRLAGARAGYCAGLLFAAHPLHVEAVAEIVGRADILCTLLILCGLVLYLRRPLTTRRAAAISACSIGAMLSKEQGMLMPFMLLALAYCRPDDANPSAQTPPEKQARQWLILGAIWPLAALIIVREEVLKLKFEWDRHFIDYATQPLSHSGLKDHLLMLFVILGHYAQLMIAPVKLSIDYGLSVLTAAASLRDPYLYAGFAMAIAFALALITSIRRRNGPAVFCLIAAALSYAIISNVIIIGTIFGERLMYLPSAFVLIWVALQCSRVRPGVRAGILTVLLILGGIRTFTYAARWNDRSSFYSISQTEQPKSVRLSILVGQELESEGRYDEAAKIAEAAAAATPDYWNIWYLCGLIEEERHDYPRALSMYNKAFDLQKSVPLQNRITMLKHKMMPDATTQP